MAKFLWRDVIIATLALGGIGLFLILRLSGFSAAASDMPLLLALVLGGMPLVYDLASKAFRGEFGSDLLAGISIATSLVLGEYLAGVIVVLMLSGGQTLEQYAIGKASSVLKALAKRLPQTGHKESNGRLVDIPVDEIAVGDLLVLQPHEICPVDGVVVEGHGPMDESYLTGEPAVISKTPGSAVLSGALNKDNLLKLRATKRAIDSRYAKIIEIVTKVEHERPRMRRLGDTLGAWYTPLAVLIAIAAWIYSGSPVRFLAVLVVATPCPLLIAIPVAIIGSISLAAKRAIIIRDPSALEQIPRCKKVIFDKTGTLTYGEPELVNQEVFPGFEKGEVLSLAASIEQYSKHPLAKAVLSAAAAENCALKQADEICEAPGEGIRGRIRGKELLITSVKLLKATGLALAQQLDEHVSGMGCVILIDTKPAAIYRFRDAPRQDGRNFIKHLISRHHFEKVMLVSGDRESEVRGLASEVGIKDVHFGISPEGKVEIVKKETEGAKTIFVGDGINDAPALLAATVGVAFGHNSDITTESAGVVVLDTSLEKVDELFHISHRMVSIALQSALGGMLISIIGMLFAAGGMLTPVAGAMIQEAIDVLAIVNALRAAFPPKSLVDFQ